MIEDEIITSYSTRTSTRTSMCMTTVQFMYLSKVSGEYLASKILQTKFRKQVLELLLTIVMDLRVLREFIQVFTCILLVYYLYSILFVYYLYNN